MCQLLVKMNNFEFCPEKDLGLVTEKSNVGIRISIAKMPYTPISGKTDNFDFFDINLPKNRFWCRNFNNLNLSPDSKSALPRYHVCQFPVKTDNFHFFGPNFPKIGN